MPSNPFDFGRSGLPASPHESFWIEIPKGIRSKDELLVVLARAGHFPDYFGYNWDALLDCLRDFRWISNRRIVIKHSDLPLLDCPADCKTYLEVLRDAVSDWGQAVSRTDGTLAPAEHELRVSFPGTARRAVDELLGP